MYATALIALDISPAEAAMLDCLDDLRAMGVARVVLVHVVRSGWTQGTALAKRDEYVAWLEGHAAPLRTAGLDVTADVRAAFEPGAEIRAAAAEHGADLIVIGSRGQSMARGIFLGSTARAVLRDSPLPVRLEWLEGDGNGGARACRAGLSRTMLATDFSRQAAAAETAAAGIDATHIDIVHVVTPEQHARYPRWPVMARAALNAITQEIESGGAKAATHLPDGTPSAEIARLAAACDAQLIILGKHGQNWIESMLIGSTAANLCEVARRPVLMVPARGAEA